MPVAWHESPAGQLLQRENATADLPPVGASLLAMGCGQRAFTHANYRRHSSKAEATDCLLEICI